MTKSITFDIKGLPPTGGDDHRTAVLISDAKDLMRKSGFTTIRNQGVKLAVVFQARAASGISDPLAVISGIVIALETAGLYSSRSAIRDLSFIRKTGRETKYSVCVSALKNQ